LGGPQVLQAAATGTLIGTGEGRAASATHADLAAAAVAVLTGDGHEGKVYELGGDVSWSLPDLAGVTSALRPPDFLRSARYLAVA
jgi:NAD(P)H dehydrogenase (quinone)